MLQFEANKGVEFCDGLTRRDFLRAAPCPPAPSACRWPTWPNSRRRRPLGGHQLYPAVPRRRPQPSRHLGPQAARARRGARPLPADPDQRARHRDLRALPADGGDGRPLRHRPLGPSQGGADPRDRPSDDADRPPVPRRPGVSALRSGAVAPARPAGRWPAAVVVLPAPIGNTGVSVSHGQGAGYLGAATSRRSVTSTPPA